MCINGDVHQRVMREVGLPPSPLRDEEGLRVEVRRPEVDAIYFGEDAARAAATLAISIVQLAPFDYGNLRTAYVAMPQFLGLNGMVLRDHFDKGVTAEEGYSQARWSLAEYLERFAREHDHQTASELFAAQLRGFLE